MRRWLAWPLTSKLRDQLRFHTDAMIHRHSQKRKPMQAFALHGFLGRGVGWKTSSNRVGRRRQQKNHAVALNLFRFAKMEHCITKAGFPDPHHSRL